MTDFQNPVSSAVAPSAPNRAEALCEDVDSIRKGGATLLRYSDVFMAFRELFCSESGAGRALSGEAMDGLSYTFKLLADDAGNAGCVLFDVHSALSKALAQRGGESHE